MKYTTGNKKVTVQITEEKGNEFGFYRAYRNENGAIRVDVSFISLPHTESTSSYHAFFDCPSDDIRDGVKQIAEEFAARLPDFKSDRAGYMAALKEVFAKK